MATILPFIDDRAVFTPDIILAMCAAFDDVCAALNLTNGSAGERESIAASIIERARCGVHDAERLREGVLNDMKRLNAFSRPAFQD
jgi:hypothetical protein